MEMSAPGWTVGSRKVWLMVSWHSWCGKTMAVSSGWHRNKAALGPLLAPEPWLWPKQPQSAQVSQRRSWNHSFSLCWQILGSIQFSFLSVASAVASSKRFVPVIVSIVVLHEHFCARAMAGKVDFEETILKGSKIYHWKMCRFDMRIIVGWLVLRNSRHKSSLQKWVAVTLL